ncbi:MAG TPA: pyridoxamine 5'-phosphate oxidase family protein [Acidimicrobiales bacterium]|nr:pyridoxamine 5'-phosphate oxidase family protein [Acidimicrobiales bacterium]
MRWADLEHDAPRLAERARERLVDPGVLLVATVRRDGTPRLSPVEPLLLDGDLWLSMMWQSRKAADLLIDDRILVHSIVTGPDGDHGEIKIRGRATPVDDPDLRKHYCDAVQSLGWRPVEPYFHLFVVDIGDMTSIRYAKSGDQHVARWPARVEFIRRETSPTSVGEPEPVTDLFRNE